MRTYSIVATMRAGNRSGAGAEGAVTDTTVTREEATALLIEALVQMAADAAPGEAEAWDAEARVLAAAACLPPGERVSLMAVIEAASGGAIAGDYVSAARETLLRRRRLVWGVRVGLVVLAILAVVVVVTRS